MASIEVFPDAFLRSKYARPSVAFRSCTVAMMCSARLICRFPARDNRCRTCSPEEASIGAVPFQDAKCARLGNRVVSPTSTSSRAAPEGPMPCRSISLVPVAATSCLSSLSASLERW
jgi:hypothetical protein